MKMLLLISILLFSGTTFAFERKMETFDQLKLAELVNRLPVTARLRKTRKARNPTEGLKVKSTFPKRASAFQINCESVYYNASKIPSSSTCQLTVDPTHPQLESSYDEYRIQIKDKVSVTALNNAISYGRPKKEFRSWDRAFGTNFEGFRGNLFYYYLVCSTELCTLKISKLDQL